MSTGKVKLRREVFNAVNTYMEHLQKTYSENSDKSIVAEQMIRDFANSLSIKRDKQFTRVFVRGSVHSFIVMEDQGKLKRGDILKCLSRVKPDTSFVHGNVLEDRYEKISWTGV